MNRFPAVHFQEIIHLDEEFPIEIIIKAHDDTKPLYIPSKLEKRLCNDASKSRPYYNQIFKKDIENFDSIITYNFVILPYNVISSARSK